MNNLFEIANPFKGKWFPAAITADPTKWTDDLFNELKYIEEGRDRDKWKLPSETVLHEGGDCEDLAIAQAHKWLQEGHEADKVAILIDWRPNKQHAVATDGKMFYDCRNRMWDGTRAATLMRKGFVPGLRLQLDGKCYMVGQVKN